MRSLLLFALMFSGIGSSSANLVYDLQIVARQGQTIGGAEIGNLSGVDLADNGLIAFSGDSGGNAHVWNATSVLAAEGQPFGGVASLPAFVSPTIQINNSGTVAVSTGFRRVFDPGSGTLIPDTSDATTGVFISTGAGKIGGLGSTIGGQSLDGAVGASIHLDNSGNVYFHNGIGGTSRGVFTQSSLQIANGTTVGPVTVALDTGSTNDSIDVDANGTPYVYSVNDPIPRALHTPAAVVVSEGDTLGTGETVDGLNTSNFAVSESGLSAFAGNTTGPDFDFFVADDNGVIVDENSVVDGKLVGFVFDFDINSNGTLAFLHGDNSVLTQDDIVIEPNDTVDGFSFLGATSDTITIIDTGEIAFIGTFDNGMGGQFQAVVLATAIPEPSAFLCVCLIATVAGTRRRKAKS